MRIIAFRELEYHYNDIVCASVWDPNKVINIGEWSVREVVLHTPLSDAVAKSVERKLPVRKVENQPNQTSDIKLIPSLKLSITRIGQGLVSSVSR